MSLTEQSESIDSKSIGHAAIITLFTGTFRQCKRINAQYQRKDTRQNQLRI